MLIGFFSDMLSHHHNNFDLIRLLASIQVFVMHGVAHLKIALPLMAAEILDWFPGVPIFFMISGLLVTHSYMLRSSLRVYFSSRALRIFPGLWACLLVSFLLVASEGNLETQALAFKTAIWVACQGTFFQFINFWPNPGVTNGALWSIATELQFYIALPFVVILGRRFMRSRMQVSATLVVFAVVSAGFHQWVLSNQIELLPRLFPTLYASILANGYFFALGALAFIWRDKLLPICSGKFFGIFAAYIILRAFLYSNGLTVTDIHRSLWSLVVYPVLGLAVYSLAYSFLNLSQLVLKGNDFHMAFTFITCP